MLVVAVKCCVHLQQNHEQGLWMERWHDPIPGIQISRYWLGLRVCISSKSRVMLLLLVYGSDCKNDLYNAISWIVSEHGYHFLNSRKQILSKNKGRKVLLVCIVLKRKKIVVVSKNLSSHRNPGKSISKKLLYLADQGTNELFLDNLDVVTSRV